jgi:hypothetical protein
VLLAKAVLPGNGFSKKTGGDTSLVFGQRFEHLTGRGGKAF